jgi:hypothetical protein
MGKWFNKNFRTIIYIAFLVPIITVAIVSISHVTVWYGISNPMSWALYLSIGIEIAALSALAAISAQMGSKVYVPFGIVTLIQFVGNIFFAFEFIKIDAVQFLSWVELTGPILEYVGIEQTDLQAHRRFLAIFAGGMLPLISLSFLHMLVKFNEEKQLETKEEESDDTKTVIEEETKIKPSEEDLNRLEELLSKFKPEERPKEGKTIFDARTKEWDEDEVVGSESREETVEDDSSDHFEGMSAETAYGNAYADDPSYDELPPEARGFKPPVNEEETLDEEPPEWFTEQPPLTDEELEQWAKESEEVDNLYWNEQYPEPSEDIVEKPKPITPNKYEDLEKYLRESRSWNTQSDEDSTLPDKVEEKQLDLDTGEIKDKEPEVTEELRNIDVVLEELPTPEGPNFSVDVQIDEIPEETPIPQPDLNVGQPLPLENQDENEPEKKNQ